MKTTKKGEDQKVAPTKEELEKEAHERHAHRKTIHKETGGTDFLIRPKRSNNPFGSGHEPGTIR